MFGKTGTTKDTVMKIVTVIIIASIFLLTISILTDDNDSRKQISDDNGATERTLAKFLSGVEGAGEVSVMMQYNSKQAVTGVIVSAEGAKDPVVKNNISKGVAILFDIPPSNVMVFEKSRRNEKNEKKAEL